MKIGWVVRQVCILAVGALIVGCAQSSTGTAGGVTPLVRSAVRVADCCNIRWNKSTVNLSYPAKGHVDAILTYWGPNGYFFSSVTCQNGGKISVTAHRKTGNPNGYMHQVIWFKAQTAGPDTCGLTAILNNTGSPPLANISLQIAK